MVIHGAGALILNEKREVLLIRRAGTTTFDNMWANPGGKTEHGEDDATTAIRETREELDIEVKLIQKLGVYSDKRGDRVIGEYSGFLASIAKGKPRILDPKIAEMHYFRLDDLPKNLAPYTRFYIEELLH